MKDIIEVKQIVKKFGNFTAIDSISFKVKKGEILGFLGPNGAGKTTTIRILTTLIRPTSGTAVIDGFDILKDPHEVRSKIGLVAEKIILYDRLTADENLRFFGRLNNLTREVIEKRSNKWISRLNMVAWRDKQVGIYSSGMKQRINVARALLTEPDILFLDEPTLGLDPQTSNLIRTFINDLRKKGMTIILTTHDMHEAESLSDRVAIIDKGKIAAIDSVNNLKKMVKGVSSPNLEDVFLTLTGREVRDFTEKQKPSVRGHWRPRQIKRIR